LTTLQAQIVLKELREGVVGGHFVGDITIKKIMDVGYSGQFYSRIFMTFAKVMINVRKLEDSTKSLAKLVTTLPEEPFMKWGLDYIGSIKPAR
jgi:hypothetical protein